MVVLNRLKYCGKYKGKLSDVRPSYVYRVQAKRLAFPWIPLAELGLFNALRRIQIKKSVSLATRVLDCAKRARTLLWRAAALSDQHKTIAHSYDFRKQSRRVLSRERTSGNRGIGSSSRPGAEDLRDYVPAPQPAGTTHRGDGSSASQTRGGRSAKRRRPATTSSNSASSSSRRW
jgi:hypothetical protein